MKKIWELIKWPFVTIYDEYKFRMRLRELRKKDPFNYK